MFDYKKIAYRDSRIENLNKSEKIEYVKSLGFSAAPVIESENLVFSGFQPAKLKEII